MGVYLGPPRLHPWVWGPLGLGTLFRECMGHVRSILRETWYNRRGTSHSALTLGSAFDV